MSNTQNLINNPTQPQVNVPPPSSSGQAGPSGVGTFVAGVAANTISALLAVMEDMMLISNIYGKLFVDQMQSQQSVATDLGNFAENQAADTASQMELQGWMQVASGGLSGAIGLGGMISSPKVGDFDSEIQGAQSYRSYMKDVEPNEGVVSNGTRDTTQQGANKTLSEDTLKALKNRSGEDFMKDSDSWTSRLKAKFSSPSKTGVTPDDIRTDPRFKEDRDAINLANKSQLEDLKSSYDDKISELKKSRETIANTHAQKWSTYTQTATGLGSAVTGFGGAFAADYKRQEGTEEAAKDTANAALQTAQGIASETRQETETYLSKASDVVQIVAAISRANSLPGGS